MLLSKVALLQAAYQLVCSRRNDKRVMIDLQSGCPAPYEASSYVNIIAYSNHAFVFWLAGISLLVMSRRVCYLKKDDAQLKGPTLGLAYDNADCSTQDISCL